MKLLRCRRGSRWCCSVDLLRVSPRLSSSGWITVGHQHINIFAVLKQHITTQKPLLLSDFHKLPLDKRVSQALNGDLYFSNVLPEDSRPDYICYARFPHTQTIQQKQPISVTVLDSKPRRWEWSRLLLFSFLKFCFAIKECIWGVTE